MVDFFTSFEWWKTEPHDELVDNGAYCLAKPGEIYAVYLPHPPLVRQCRNTWVSESECARHPVKLEPGVYKAKLFSAAHRGNHSLAAVQGPVWTLPKPPGWLDWALLLRTGG